MDKYTVDLDQVLNDFEYSELTDQYNNVPRNASSTTSSSSQNITKHSINNVFHSLNEYLNTSITVTGSKQIDNNLLEDKENCLADVNVLNICQNKLRDDERSIKDCNLKTDFAGKIKENKQFNIDKSDNRDSFKKSNVDVEEDNLEEYTKKCENNSISNRDIRGSEETIFAEAKITEDIVDTVETVPAVEEEQEEVNREVTVTEESHSEVIDEVCERVVEAVTVGFDDDLNLDDSELNKLLEELEEEGLQENEEEPPTVAENVQYGCESTEKETKEARGDGDHHHEVHGTIPEVVPAEKASQIEEEKTEQVEGVMKSEIMPDIDLNGSSETDEHEAGQDENDNVSKFFDAENSKEAGEQDLSDDSVEQTGYEAKDIKDIVEVVLEKPITTEDNVEIEVKELEMEKETSQDSISRPQDLPLTSGTEEPKRKINLIGDPGSTPYNNVYINKEIPRSKHKAYDSDTDYSSSPTFSDASSTASTVSADEARHEIKPEIALAPDTSRESKKPSENTAPEVTEEEMTKPEVESLTSQRAPAASDTEALQVANDLPPGADVDSNESNNAGTFHADAGAVQAGNSGEADVNAIGMGKQWLGKEKPLWIPDADAMSCLHCDMKFTVLKRRHHCRACGLVLCAKCCHLRFRLEYLDAEARVCNKCHDILNKDTNSSSGSDLSPEAGNSPSYRPHPNNPLEYCSTVSPLQQVAGANPNPPAVMVPVGVLKRKGSTKGKTNKSVMFCDGIRPGSDLTNLDSDFDYNNTKTKRLEVTNAPVSAKSNRNLPALDPVTNTFIPSSEIGLPPTVTACKTDILYADCVNNPEVVETLKNEQLTFAIHVNLYVHVRIISMSCCVNKTAWCFSTDGLINVGQDEIVILLEYIDEESFVPKDVFHHINNVYNDAVKGTSVKELGLSLHNSSNFLDSKNHAGFVYIHPTFQCLENVIKPKEPYLIGILIHRWETPWAKLFPLRLILRLGAEYRYYPSPIISTRHRDSVFVEIGHTIINLLADFRNFSYTLPQIRGLTIHMEDKNTTITIPANRYDQVMKSMNNSSDHILAFAGNFSLQADSHLVCIQDTQGNENCYSTHAINIHNKPRKVTGASFIVFNGALKSSSGLTAKSNIVEDGLMIQVLPEHMEQIRESLRAMKDHTIACGCVNAASDETVNIVWGENDVNFNVGILSSIDNMPLSGIPSIRVHNAKNHPCVNGSRIIRWTEVFIIQSGDDNPKNQDPVDVSRISESIAKATCDALVKYLDLLVANNCQKLSIRTNLHVENVSYSAGSNGSKLPPIYMRSLDNELIPVLHRITTNNFGDSVVILELIFRILNV